MFNVFSEFFGSFIGGMLNTFLSFPISAVVLGELILAEVHIVY